MPLRQLRPETRTLPTNEDAIPLLAKVRFQTQVEPAMRQVKFKSRNASCCSVRFPA